MKPTQRVRFTEAGRTETQHEGAPTARSESFVINLCPVPVPITISQPRSPQLTRFRFFSSRLQDEGRERYWLHMGYFSTRAEAQQWVKILRSDYPDASVSKARDVFQREHSAGAPAEQLVAHPGVVSTPGVTDATARAGRHSAATKASITDGATVIARARSAAVALGETLEHLQSSDWELDGDALNGTGACHLRVEVYKDAAGRLPCRGPSARTRKT